mmetsp:Transcript_76788/g.167792  ORF Transcript_76788/g.167792 Transcript_76788/m.167792 type:complete len:212 (-) Transcript_76788:2395-3030(-)
MHTHTHIGAIEPEAALESSGESLPIVLAEALSALAEAPRTCGGAPPLLPPLSSIMVVIMIMVVVVIAIVLVPLFVSPSHQFVVCNEAAAIVVVGLGVISGAIFFPSSFRMLAVEVVSMAMPMATMVMVVMTVMMMMMMMVMTVMMIVMLTLPGPRLPRPRCTLVLGSSEGLAREGVLCAFAPHQGGLLGKALAAEVVVLTFLARESWAQQR